MLRHTTAPQKRVLSASFKQVSPYWITRKFSPRLHPSLPAYQLLFPSLYGTHRNPRAGTCSVSRPLPIPLCRQLVTRHLVRSTRRFAVCSAAWCALSIDSRWSVPIASRRPDLRSSPRIMNRSSTGSSSEPRSRGTYVSSRRRNSGGSGCSHGHLTVLVQSRLSVATVTTS